VVEAGCEIKARKHGGATSRDARCRPKRRAGAGPGYAGRRRDEGSQHRL